MREEEEEPVPAATPSIPSAVCRPMPAPALTAVPRFLATDPSLTAIRRSGRKTQSPARFRDQYQVNVLPHQPPLPSTTGCAAQDVQEGRHGAVPGRVGGGQDGRARSVREARCLDRPPLRRVNAFAGGRFGSMSLHLRSDAGS